MSGLKNVVILSSVDIIAFEIGDDQGEIISDIAKMYYPNSSIILKNDLNNLNRYLFIINE